jgi:PTS system mannitol-specific IIC component
MKEKVQSFGRFLSAMVMPNIGAFIAWGLLAALFISTGWLPNARLATLVNPILAFLLPTLIAINGGRMVGGDRGGVAAAVATMGVIVSGLSIKADGSMSIQTTMLMGAMIMGPLAGWLVKKMDQAFEGHIKAGFEMLVNNFDLGILAMLLAIVGYYIFGPVMTAIMNVLLAGATVLKNHGLLPLISIIVEPAKVLFLNNAINHGIFTPMGAAQVKEAGKSIFYMIEANPGPGTGVLLAYWFFAKDKTTKQSAPAALIVHLFGGIHEISFPYILMNPLLLLATISGSAAAMAYNSIFNLGLVSPASPGSIFAFVGMAPKGQTLAVLLSIVIAAAVSFLIAAPIVRLSNPAKNLNEASDEMASRKAAAKGIQLEKRAGANMDLSQIHHIVFACDAGMGSSAMGSGILKNKLKDAGLGDIEVTHASVSSIPPDAQLVVCHEDLAERAQNSAPNARLVTITNFMTAPEYDEIVADIEVAKSGADHVAVSITEEGKEDKEQEASEVLLKQNIMLNGPEKTKEEVLKKMGKVLSDSGYATERYTEALFEKEKVFNTAIGNEIAIPHGVETMRDEILKSGIAIFTYPEGIDWGDGQIVKLVIGVASVGDAHIDTLQKIAEICAPEGAVDNIVNNMDADQIYELFK